MPALLQVATMSWFFRAFLLPISRHFRALGWTVDGAANGTSICPDCTSAFTRVWEVDFSRNPLKPQNLVNGIRGIRELVRREGYDLVHVHTPVAAFATRFALRGLRRSGAPKVIYTAHGFHFYKGNHPAKNALFLAAEKLAGRWTDFLVVINSEDYEAAIAHGIMPRERVRYMPGGASGLPAWRSKAVRRSYGMEGYPFPANLRSAARASSMSASVSLPDSTR